MKIDGNDGGRALIAAAAGALFTADTVATGHAALKHALQPHNRTLQLDTYDTIDDVVNHFHFIQSREYYIA